MITIEKYTSHKQFESYFNLVEQKYQNFETYSYFIGDLKKAIEYCFDNPYQEVFLLKHETKIKLHAQLALIIDKRFPANEAFFGFFECVQEQSVFNELFAAIKLLAKEHGIEKLSGPVNGTIWHSYRLVIGSEEIYKPFLSDLLCESYYYQWFKSKNPLEEIGYYSGMRKKTESLIHLTEPAYQSLVEKGLIVTILEAVSKPYLEQFFSIAHKSFSSSWGFVQLTFDEFVNLYNSEKVSSFISLVYVVEWQNQVVGFCTVLKQKQRWILKTMAIDPLHQGIGIGNALVHKIHSDAKVQGANEVIYALIRDTNKIQFFPKDDAREIRRYACFTFKI